MNLRFKPLKAYRIQVLMLGIVLSLSSCSTVPKNLRSAPEVSSAISDVQTSPESHRNEIVRWGGSIVDMQQSNGETVIQVVSRPLSASTRPSGEDQTDGRFLAVFEGFLEPEIYKEKRLLTVLGHVNGLETRKIGDLDYAFPVVKVQAHHLWQKETQLVYPYRPGDPWGYWYSAYPYPYSYPYYYYDGFYPPFRHRPPRSHRY